MLHAADFGDALENGVGERFLEVVAARRGKLLEFRSQKVVIPGARRIIVLGYRDIFKPDLDGNQQSLRGANLEIMKANVCLHGQ